MVNSFRSVKIESSHFQQQESDLLAFRQKEATWADCATMAESAPWTVVEIHVKVECHKLSIRAQWESS